MYQRAVRLYVFFRNLHYVLLLNTLSDGCYLNKPIICGVGPNKYNFLISVRPWTIRPTWSISPGDLASGYASRLVLFFLSSGINGYCPKQCFLLFSRNLVLLGLIRT